MNGLKGKLSAAFRTMSLASLQREFFAATAHKKDAQQTLEHFYRAASKLNASENEFNRRTRPAPETLLLMGNLRDRSQFAALRAFNSAKEGLLNISPEIGTRIVRLVEKGIDQPSNHSAGLGGSFP